MKPVALLAAAALALAGCGGSGHPAASAPPAATTAPALTCARFPVRALARDMRRQDRLAAQMNSGPPPHLRRSVEDDILAGAWVDPGAYSGDLDQFVAAASSVSPSALSNPDSLAYDLAAVVRDAGTLKNDVLTPPISVADWLAFKDDLAALALDCGTSIH